MAILLKWKNPNTGASVVRIYRSATPINTANMVGVNPIVEITNGALSYLDEFPKYGQSFYYVFSVVVNGREIFSINKLYSAIIDVGPGPKDILIGDFKLGYFGPCSTGDLGIASTIYGSTASFYTLHKIARNGKILYIPGKPLQGAGFTINGLKANKVLTSGVTARNDPFAGAGGQIIDVNGRLFAPRVAKLFDEANADTTLANYGVYGGLLYPSPANANTPTGKSELVDILRICLPQHPGIPARFCLNTEPTGYQTTYDFTRVGSCDFTTATTTPSFGLMASFSTVTQVDFNAQLNFHPVIEYKGTV
jgi:hypothetical protein